MLAALVYRESLPPAYYAVGNVWKSLECVIVSGDLIYAFNRAGSVSKLMVFRMKTAVLTFALLRTTQISIRRRRLVTSLSLFSLIRVRGAIVYRGCGEKPF